MKPLTNSGQRELHFPSHIAEIRVSYSSRIAESSRPKITSSQDAVDILRVKWRKSRIQYIEEFKVILMNRANRVLGIHHVSRGGISGCVVDPKVIFAAALKANASSLLLAHNHPSGNTTPSDADMRLTRKLKDAGGFLDLPILDHIILTKDSFYSMADQGLI